MDIEVVFEKLALALGLGLLVGLQRERVHSPLAGIRTFALITLFGAILSLLSQQFGGWIVACGAVAVTLILLMGNYLASKTQPIELGVTTEIAAMLMYGLGAYLMVGNNLVAIVLGGTTALLLHWKTSLHTFVSRLGEADVHAIMRFVLIALVIFPVLPNEYYGPYKVLNPRNIWFMVVLIVGISLAAYVAYKWFGAEAGTILGGIFGGLISSTATTLSFARRSNGSPTAVPLVGLVLLIATGCSLLRVLAEIAIVAPEIVPSVCAPLVVLLIWVLLLSGGMYFLAKGQLQELPPQGNPAELKSAVIFAVVFAVVLIAIAAARRWLGEQGLYAVAILSGSHDLDAITLSTAQMVQNEDVSADTGWRLVMSAIVANLVVKQLIVSFFGNRRLMTWSALLLGSVALGALLLLLLWPVS